MRAATILALLALAAVAINAADDNKAAETYKKRQLVDPDANSGCPRVFCHDVNSATHQSDKCDELAGREGPPQACALAKCPHGASFVSGSCSVTKWRGKIAKPFATHTGGKVNAFLCSSGPGNDSERGVMGSDDWASFWRRQASESGAPDPVPSGEPDPTPTGQDGVIATVCCCHGEGPKGYSESESYEAGGSYP